MKPLNKYERGYIANHIYSEMSFVRDDDAWMDQFEDAVDATDPLYFKALGSAYKVDRDHYIQDLFRQIRKLCGRD